MIILGPCYKNKEFLLFFPLVSFCFISYNENCVLFLVHVLLVFEDFEVDSEGVLSPMGVFQGVT